MANFVARSPASIAHMFSVRVSASTERKTVSTLSQSYVFIPWQAQRHINLLAARLFESEPAAKATFPTPFSPGELGNDAARILKGKEDRFEGECGQR